MPSNQLYLMDVDMVIKGCEGLPKMDYIGHADPYVILQIFSPDGRQTIKYKSAVVYNTGKPTWDEEINIRNVPVGSRCTFQIRDKDRFSSDEDVGSCQLVLSSVDTVDVGGFQRTSAPAVLGRNTARSLGAGSRTSATAAALHRHTTGVPLLGPGSSSARDGETGRTVELPIQAAPGVPVSAGWLVVEVRCRPARAPGGHMQHVGPVRYRMSASVLAGALTGIVQDNGWKSYAAYKLSLVAVRDFFPEGAELHWNTSYHNAVKVFTNSVVVTAVRTQHTILYADSRHQLQRGVLRGGGDFVALLRGGVRARQRRYYTYCVDCDGNFCFSETGAAFFSDFMSKHAMHADCDERVVYAGEFCLVPPGLHTVSASPRCTPDSPRGAMSPRSMTAPRLLYDGAAPYERLDTSSPLLRRARTPPPPPPPPLQRSSRIRETSAAPLPRDPIVSEGGASNSVLSSQRTFVGKLSAQQAAEDAALALAALQGVGGCQAPGWRMVVDNNSGTYAPPAELLPALAALLRHNFPGLEVETVAAVGDGRLEEYHARIPSRVR